MKAQNTENKEVILGIEEIIEDLSGLEFKFIRKSFGISQQDIANNFSLHSRSSISKWEKYERVGAAQAFCLKSFIPDALWKHLRRKWKNYNGNRKNLLASVSPRKTSKLPSNIVTIPILKPGKAYGRKF